MPVPPPDRLYTARKLGWLAPLGFGLLLVVGLAGCAMFHAEGQVGPDLRPHFGTSISVPLGK